MIVSGNYFDVLRVEPALGRGFLPEEDKTRGTHPWLCSAMGCGSAALLIPESWARPSF